MGEEWADVAEAADAAAMSMRFGSVEWSGVEWSGVE